MKLTLAYVPMLGRRAEREHWLVLSFIPVAGSEISSPLCRTSALASTPEGSLFFDVFSVLVHATKSRNQRHKEWGETSSEHIMQSELSKHIANNLVGGE